MHAVDFGSFMLCDDHSNEAKVENQQYKLTKLSSKN